MECQNEVSLERQYRIQQATLSSFSSRLMVSCLETWVDGLCMQRCRFLRYLANHQTRIGINH